MLISMALCVRLVGSLTEKRNVYLERRDKEWQKIIVSGRI